MEDAGLLSGLMHFISFAVIGVCALQANANRRDVGHQVRLFLIMFSVRFAMAIVLYQFGFVRYLGDEDSSGWVVGAAYAEGWNQQGVDFIDLPRLFAQSYELHHKGYYYVLGILYFITGSPTRLAAAALNCFIGALTGIVGYRTATTLFSQRIGVRVGWWLCFYPSLIIWSAQTVKEPIVIFLESLAVYGCVALRQRGVTLKHVASMLLSIVLLIPFRFYAAYLAGATVVLSILLGGAGTGRRNTVGQFVLSTGVAISALIIALALVGGEKESELIQHYDLAGIEKYRNAIAESTTSGVKIEYDLRSPGGLTASVAIGSAHLLFAPFPWQLATGSLRMLLVAPEVVLWWWLLLAGVWPGLKYTMRTRLRDILPLVFMVIGLGLLYSMMFSNVGLVYRQRAQLLPWLLIFGVVGRDIVSSRNQRHNVYTGKSHKEGDLVGIGRGIT